MDPKVQVANAIFQEKIQDRLKDITDQIDIKYQEALRLKKNSFRVMQLEYNLGDYKKKLFSKKVSLNDLSGIGLHVFNVMIKVGFKPYIEQVNDIYYIGIKWERDEYEE